MVIGFALAFMILGWENSNAATFDEPFRGLVKALVMTIGEYDFDDFYNSFEDDGLDDDGCPEKPIATENLQVVLHPSTEPKPLNKGNFK